MTAVLTVSSVADAASRDQLHRWCEDYHLDERTAEQKYVELTGSDYGSYVRARMYFEQNNAFELLAYASGEVKKENRLDVVKSLLAKKEYSPSVTAVVLQTLEQLHAGSNPDDEPVKAYAATALARWLNIPDPKIRSTIGSDRRRKQYDDFISRARSKATNKRLF